MVADAERLGDRRLEADVHVNIAFIRQFRGDRPENSPFMRHSIEKMREIAKELNDPFISAIPDALIGLFQVFTGDMIEGIAKLREAAPMLEEKHAFVLSSFSYVALSIGLSRLGRFDEAEDAARRAMKLGENGDLIAKLDSMIGESTVHSLRGDLETAVPIAMRCTAMSEETGATACVVASNFVLGDTYMRQGNFKSAQIAFERSNEVAESFGENSFRPSLLAYMRANSASLGAMATNGDAFKEALALAQDNGDKFSEAAIIWKRGQYEAGGDSPVQSKRWRISATLRPVSKRWKPSRSWPAPCETGASCCARPPRPRATRSCARPWRSSTAWASSARETRFARSSQPPSPQRRRLGSATMLAPTAMAMPTHARSDDQTSPKSPMASGSPSLTPSA